MSVKGTSLKSYETAGGIDGLFYNIYLCKWWKDQINLLNWIENIELKIKELIGGWKEGMKSCFMDYLQQKQISLQILILILFLVWTLKSDEIWILSWATQMQII